MTRRYTPVEILQAGITATDRDHANLHLELERLQAALCWHWHRINIDPDVSLLDGEERLPVHLPPPGFGGCVVAIPVRSVDRERLTQAGRELYAIGARLQLRRLVTDILFARAAVDDAERALTVTERRALAAAAEHAAAAARHRAAAHAPVPVQGDAWAVRLPGTTTWTTHPPAVDRAQTA